MAIVLCVIIYIVIIAPLFISVNINFFNQYKRINFTIKFLDFIKIVGGCIFVKDRKLTLKLNGKEKIVELNDILKLKNASKPLKDYHVYNVNTKVLFGKDVPPLVQLNYKFFSNSIISAINIYAYEKKTLS